MQLFAERLWRIEQLYRSHGNDDNVSELTKNHFAVLVLISTICGMPWLNDASHLLRTRLNLLIVFDAVAELRSVTAAAERLSLSQPALSHALRHLRDLFGDRLFLRGGDGLTLTPKAMALVRPIRELLNSAQVLLQPEAFAPETLDQEVRIVIAEASLGFLADKAVKAIAAAAPGLRIRLDHPEADGERKVRTGLYDLCLWYADAVSPPLHAQELFRDRYVGVVHAGHPLARRPAGRDVTLAQYSEAPHFRLDLPGLRHDPLDAALARHDMTRTVRVTSHSFLPVFRSLGPVIATVPSHLAATGRRAGLDLHTFDLPFEVAPLPFMMIWSDHTDRDPANLWMRHGIADAFAASIAAPAFRHAGP